MDTSSTELSDSTIPYRPLIGVSRTTVCLFQALLTLIATLQSALLVILVLVLVKFVQADVLTERYSRFTGFVNEKVGIHINPAGVLLTSAEKVYVPAVLDLSYLIADPFNNSIYDNLYCCWNQHSNNKDFREHSISATRKIINSKAEAYSNFLNTGYLNHLMNGLCSEDEELCEYHNVTVRVERNKRVVADNQTVRVVREKRLIGLLAGAAFSGLVGITGLGLGISSQVDLRRVEGKIQAIETKLRTLKTEVMSEITTLKEGQENIIRLTTAMAKNLKANMDKSFCRVHFLVADMGNALYANQLGSMVDSIIDSIMATARHGRIAPSLIPPEDVAKLVTLQHGLEDSLLALEPSLFYQTSFCVPVHIDIKKMQFGFIIEVPILKEQNLKPIFRVQNLGWNDPEQQLTFRIKSPTYVTTDNVAEKRKPFFGVDVIGCKQSIGVYFCPADLISGTHNECLRSAIDSKNDKNLSKICDFEMKQMSQETEVVTTVAGVLIRTTEKQARITNSDQLGSHQQGVTISIPPNGVLWRSQTDFQLIVVGDRFIRSTNSKMTTAKVKPAYSKPPKLRPQVIPPTGWTSYDNTLISDARTQRMIDYRIQEHTTVIPGVSHRIIGYLSLILIVIMIIIIILLIIRYCCGIDAYRLTRSELHRWRQNRRRDREDSQRVSYVPNSEDQVELPQSDTLTCENLLASLEDSTIPPPSTRKPLSAPKERNSEMNNVKNVEQPSGNEPQVHPDNKSSALIDIEVEGVKTTALWDSGAMRTCIRTDFYDHLKEKLKKGFDINFKKEILKSFSGADVIILGTAILKF